MAKRFFAQKDRHTRHAHQTPIGPWPMDYDSDSDTDMASGSRNARYRGLKGDRVPRWDAQKTTYDSWWYEMVPYLKTQGLWDTAQGVNESALEE